MCTKQLCDYRDNLDAFANLGVDVLAINPQDLASHERFATKHSLPFPLLADTDKSVCRSYGALGWFGMAKRALVLIGRDGRVRWSHTDLPIFHRSAEQLREVIEDNGLDGMEVVGLHDLLIKAIDFSTHLPEGSSRASEPAQVNTKNMEN